MRSPQYPASASSPDSHSMLPAASRSPGTATTRAGSFSTSFEATPDATMMPTPKGRAAAPA
jgi:hypothetical protein